jgi:hypothetical protein
VHVKIRFSMRLVSAVTLAVAISSCSDSGVTTPATPSGAANKLLLNPPSTVNVVTRDAPLDTAQSASALIGIWGGRISLPGAGLTVVVPAFAVTSPTQITVTAVAGSEVAYEFEPHGTRFLVPLLVTQDLHGTSADSSGILPSVLYAGYFRNLAALDQLDATAVISELLGTSISGWQGSATFAVWHFSGYLLATGEADTGGDGSQ